MRTHHDYRIILITYQRIGQHFYSIISNLSTVQYCYKIFQDFQEFKKVLIDFVQLNLMITRFFFDSQ